MSHKAINYLVLCVMLLPGKILLAQNEHSFIKYHTPGEVRQMLQEFQQNNAEVTKLHEVATSPGGKQVTILEIGSNQQDVPAVFVGANFEGNIPLATEGALRLATMLIDSTNYTSGMKWYILPNPNPDAASGYFSNVKYGRTVNDFEINNDADDAVNEDGVDDLNGDGWITQMRVKSPEGTHNVSEEDSRIMVRADTKNNERGKYKIFPEGLDNDGDGKYNEDGEGGINVGIAFPHLFPEENKEAGIWPGQAPEVYGLLQFIFDRPEIAMVFTLGSSNFCLVPPASNRKGDVNLDKIKIPSRFARRLDAEENKTYSMDEVIEMVKELVPGGTEVTPAMVAGMLGLGAAVNPQKEDLKFYNKFSKEYKEFLKEKSFNTEMADTVPAKDGSFELWAYYHLGVPSFSMNLFSVPKTNTDENDEKEEEKNENKKGGLSDKEKALLAWSDKEWEGNGFVDWQTYQHPDLGEVEIGGFVPYLETTPKAERIDSLLNIQLPWLLQLTKKLPQISITEEKVTGLGAGVFKLELFVENNGTLSYPIAMGQRNNQPAPVVIVLDGDFELLEGQKRTPLGSIGGNQVKKLTWLIKANKRADISAKIESAVFGEKVKQINMGG